MKRKSVAKALIAAKKAVLEARYELTLFIAGTTPLSTAALRNIVSVCEERLPGRYDLVVVDVYQEPQRARVDQVVAIPTLLRRSPAPPRRLIGDLSDRALVLSGLDLPILLATAHESAQ